MIIDEAEVQLRIKVCKEFQVEPSDVFKRGKPSELRRRIEARMNDVRDSSKGDCPPMLTLDEYTALADSLSPPIEVESASAVIPPEPVPEKLESKPVPKYRQVADPNPKPLHDIPNMSKIKFSIKDVPEFLKPPKKRK